MRRDTPRSAVPQQPRTPGSGPDRVAASPRPAARRAPSRRASRGLRGCGGAEEKLPADGKEGRGATVLPRGSTPAGACPPSGGGLGLEGGPRDLVPRSAPPRPPGEAAGTALPVGSAPSRSPRPGSRPAPRTLHRHWSWTVPRRALPELLTFSLRPRPPVLREGSLGAPRSLGCWTAKERVSTPAGRALRSPLRPRGSGSGSGCGARPPSRDPGEVKLAPRRARPRLCARPASRLARPPPGSLCSAGPPARPSAPQRGSLRRPRLASPRPRPARPSEWAPASSRAPPGRWVSGGTPEPRPPPPPLSTPELVGLLGAGWD